MSMRIRGQPYAAGAGRPAPGAAAARWRARRRGQMLIIVLIALTALVGLVFYVYNAGEQINRRVALQHAADSTAVSGATWMARSMNVVAMNNCAQSRLMAVVPILDALPVASRMALTEVTSWEARLAEQLRHPIQETPRHRALLRDGLETLRGRMAAQRDILRPMDAAMNRSGFEMAQTTFWALSGAAGPPPHGMLWRAAVTLDECSQATVASAGVLAQYDAVRFGQANRAETCLLVPVLPRLPAKDRGASHFRHFEPVLRGSEKVLGHTATFSARGGAGGGIPDGQFHYRLGPWARLFHWRDYISRATDWQWVPPSPGVGQTRGGGGSVSVGGRSRGGSARTRTGGGHPGHWRATEWETIGYHTYGPYRWAMRRLHGYAVGDRYRPGELVDTFFYDYMHRLADAKLEYMFGSKQIVQTHEPDWITEYGDARAVAARDEDSIHQTMFYLVEIASKYPENSSRWLSPGTYRTNGEYPIAIWAGGWVDPEQWHVPKVSNHIWKDKFTYETTVDWEIGIRQKDDNHDGQPDWQPVYMVQWYLWGGIDVGGDIDVRNPCNWDDEADLPAPILLDTTVGEYADAYDQGDRREQYSFLGLARTHDRATVWGRRFAGANPIDGMIAVAQAKLFNHSSWDLWTQDWRVQLAPVGPWGEWVRRLQEGMADAPAVGDVVDAAALDETRQYVESLEAGMMDTYLKH
jgi:hypothetical protein